MNPLQNQIAELEKLLVVLQSSGENKITMQEYASIIGSMDPVRGNLKEKYTSREILGGLPGNRALIGLNEEESEQLKISQTVIGEFIHLWNELDYKSRQDDILDNAKQVIDKLNSKIEITNKDAWNEWIGDLLERFEVVDAALDSQNDVPSLRHVISEYRSKRDEFRKLTSSIPDDASIIEQISSLTDTLESLRGKMIFNLPEAVKKFFEYLSDPARGHQFPLVLLTKDVIQWLDKNNELINYVVKRKGVY